MTYLLVPGAGGSSWYWHRLVWLLETTGHRAIPVDLPSRDETAGLAAYADAIVAAGSGQEAVTLVAQSMAGFPAPLACDRLDVDRIVLVNAMVPRPGETPGEWWSSTGQAQARADRAQADGRVLSEEFDVVEEFFHDVPAEIVREAFDRPEDARQADRPFADPWPLTRWPDVPTTGVAGREDRFFPAEFQRRVARERLGIDLEVLPGGHLMALSRPEALAAYLTQP